MAQNTNSEKLKHDALRAIHEGRQEISAEVQRVRAQLSPGHVLQRVVRRHAGLLMVLAVSVGIIPVLLIFRGKRSSLPELITTTTPPSKPVLGALLLGAIGMLAKAVTPALIKSTILPHVLDFIAKKQPINVASVPPD
jgi:hypothetical protein